MLAIVRVVDDCADISCLERGRIAVACLDVIRLVEVHRQPGQGTQVQDRRQGDNAEDYPEACGATVCSWTVRQ